MARAIIIFVGFVVVLAACTQRAVCPAYQSAFIYDKNELRKKFSYFQEDSTPKILTASKNKYLVAEPTPYRKKIRSLQTVEARKFFVQVPDSISGKQTDSLVVADMEAATRSVIDSTFIVDVPRDTVESEEDSTYVISKDREVRVLKYNMPDSLEYDEVTSRYVPQRPKYYVDEVGFNTEQDNYMWYLRHSLILPDVKLAQQQSGERGGERAKAEKKEKKGFLGFFKNLFKKKEPVDTDSAELELPQQEEFDFIDTTEVEPVIVPQQKPKKTEVNPAEETEEQITTDPQADKPKKKRKKKDKKSKEPQKEQPEEKKKEEDEDDGF
jgi:hypothetical protein